MSGELLAVLIAGGIAILPTIVQTIVNVVEKGQSQKHEETLKRIELYEIPKRENLLKYLDLLGSVCAAFSKPEMLSEYSAAYAKASVLVEETTLNFMGIIDKMVTERYNYQKKLPEREYDKGILNTSDYHTLREHIRNEISSKE